MVFMSSFISLLWQSDSYKGPGADKQTAACLNDEAYSLLYVSSHTQGLEIRAEWEAWTTSLCFCFDSCAAWRESELEVNRLELDSPSGSRLHSGTLHSREGAIVWKGMETACRLALIYSLSPPAKSNKSQHYGPLSSESRENGGKKEGVGVLCKMTH